ncbi:Ribosomal_L5 domain-containing protein/Ribosomal_L5_C domain-containing protein, partial [Cephalotus follicularis]
EKALLISSQNDMANRLKTTYMELIAPLLKEKFSYTNIHKVPKVEKIIVKCGVKDGAQNAKSLNLAMNDLAVITGQRPFAKTQERNSRVRDGPPLGVFVTLRGNVMYSFLDRLINLGDFQALTQNSFDGSGNYRIAVREQSVFPEIWYDALTEQRRMDICIRTTAETDQEAQMLLAFMGMPFGEGGGSTILTRSKKPVKHHFDSKSKGRGRR